ncbi:MAG: four helix bundle protein [Thermoguttaceae bacterium]
MTVKDYRELIVWQKSMDLVTAVYQATDGFPKTEIYGLTSQIRRAAISIPSNIAEGQARNTTRDFLQFLAIAYGSLKELETQILIAQRLKYLENPISTKLVESTTEIARLLSGLANSLKSRTASQ